MRRLALLLALLPGSCSWYRPSAGPDGLEEDPAVAETRKLRSLTEAYLAWNAAVQGRCSKADFESRAGVLREYLGRASRIDTGILAQADFHSLLVLKNRLRAELLEVVRIGSWRRDPGFYAMMIRCDGRSGEIPKILACARENLEDPPAVFVKAALEEFAALRRTLEGDAKAVEAVDAFVAWLRSLPPSKADFALGAGTLAAKLSFEEMIDAPLEELLKRGYAVLDGMKEQGGEVRAAAVPVHARRFRQALDSVSFTEGWALYVGQFNVEIHPGERGLQRRQEAGALRAICRYIAVLELHTRGKTFEEAMAFFMKEGRLERAGAEREARLAAVDPSVMFPAYGLREILALREAFGRPPEEFHKALLAHGAIPFKILRRILLGGS